MARQTINRAIETKGNERDRSGEDAGNDADCVLDPEPHERERCKQLGSAREAQPRRTAAGRNIDIRNQLPLYP
jgi:hypothetical protein